MLIVPKSLQYVFFLNYPALFILNSKEFCVEWIEIPGNQIFTSLPFTHHPAYLLLPNPCGVAVRFRHLSSKRFERIQSTFWEEKELVNYSPFCAS